MELVGLQLTDNTLDTAYYRNIQRARIWTGLSSTAGAAAIDAAECAHVITDRSRSGIRRQARQRTLKC